MGGEVEIKRTCFYSNPTGINDIPILLDGVPASGIVDSLNNFVNGTWNCGFVAERQGDNVTCRGDLSVFSDRCQSRVKDINVFW